jgi:hypothetical protein
VARSGGCKKEYAGGREGVGEVMDAEDRLG